MDLWIEIGRLLLSFFSIIVIPLGGLLFKRINSIDIKFQSIENKIDQIQERSSAYDENFVKNWLHFYKNEIIRFSERLKTKPDRIPTEEHYRSVFENYTRYCELGGNGYIHAIMDNIKIVFRIHHGFDIEDLNKK